MLFGLSAMDLWKSIYFQFFITIFFFGGGGGGGIKNASIFTTVLRGAKLLKTSFSRLILGEKIKNFVFLLPPFGRENKKTYFSRLLGGEKIKILFIFTTIFWERK